MHPWIEHLKTLGAEWGVRVLAALAIFVIGRWLAGRIARLTAKLLERGRVDPTIVVFARHLTYFGLLIVAILAALNRLGIETTSLVAIVGAAGIAIGLALQGSLSNFASGIMLILFKPFRVGDFIEGGGAAGTVEDISVFTTRLRTGDNKAIVVPNAKLTADNVVNHSAKGTRRIDLTIGVSYRENLATVKTLLAEILAADARILRDPAPEIGVLALAESGVQIVVRPWVKAADYWPVHFQTLETIKARFEAAGIVQYGPRELLLKKEPLP